jgi:Bacteriophage tail sheath protein
VRGLVFEDQATVPPSAPNRVDVACFVGFIGRRGGAEPPPVPAPVRTWLEERGWLTPPYRRTLAARLRDVPVPIDSWEAFDQLFAWESRRLAAGRTGVTYLGAAVRSFFAQGGRRCYVVSVDEPWEPGDREGRRQERLATLIPGYPDSVTASPVDPTTWHGIGHVLGLPDVSFLCLPDLPDVVAVDPPPPVPAVVPPPIEEHFAECSAGEAPPTEDKIGRLFRAPRCDEEAYLAWADAVDLVVAFLARHRREAQLLAAVPMPLPGSEAEADFASLVKGLIDRQRAGRPTTLRTPGERTHGLPSSFAQLVYPWVRTTASDALPERLESPDGVLAGVLARNALTRGTFLSAAGSPLADVYDVRPLLRPEDLLAREDTRYERVATALDERVSILGRSPAGMRLLTDVTASADESYRPASVHRLIAVIVRAARRIGESMTFDASGETMWAQVRDRLNTLLVTLFQAGALRGRSAAEAFRVRCDRTTMTQADIDAGRVIAEVRVEAAAPVEQIRVIIALDDAGRLAAASADVGLEAA